MQALDKKIFSPYYVALIRLLIVFGADGRTEAIGDRGVGFYGNAMDRSEGAQQNEGRNIPAHTGSDPAVRHAAGGAEQAHGLIAGGSETGGQRIAVWKISAQEA